MRAIEIDFSPRLETRGDETGQFDDTLAEFIGHLSKNGHLLSDSDIQLELADRVQVRAIAAANDALDAANWNLYARGNWEKLLELSVQEPEIRFIAEVDEDDGTCQCAASSSLIFFMTFAARTSPVDCLECGLPVPLFRLPHLKQEDEHWTLRNWGKSYQTLDQLYMNSWWGERMAYHQLSNPRAGFIKHSREVARELEERSSRIVYVYLMHSYQQWDEKCPLCRRDWIWHDTSKPLFHFKCDHCRLISSEAWNGAEPLSELHP